MNYPKLPTLKKKKDNQSLVVLIDGPLPSPSCFSFFNAAGQLFYRRIHSSHVMADTLGGEEKLSLAEASKNLYNNDRLHLCLMSKFLTPSTCKLETKSFLDTVFTIIDQNNQALVIFFFSR